MSCSFCGTPVYVKTIQYSRPVCAPLTEVEELRHRLLDLTGEVYLFLPAVYCPMCGERLNISKEE